MKRLLIVSPAFHGYCDSVARGFEEIGYDVKTFKYDLTRSSVEKVWNKLRHEFPSQITGDGLHLSVERVTNRALEAVRSAPWDCVLVIRGDLFAEDFWQQVNQHVPHVGVWIYDEIRRTRFDPHMVAQYARIATYSLHDAAYLTGEGLWNVHVDNAFDPSRKPSAVTTGTGTFSFIGAPLERRVAALTAMAKADLPVRAWGRGWSTHPVDMLRTWRRTSPGVPNARDIPYEEALAVMWNSFATLNIHGDQDGFTMRTFESSGWGALQIVDRPDVARLYEPGSEVLVYESLEELIDIARKIQHAPGAFDDVRERARRRSLAEHTFAHRARRLEATWTAEA